jgi:hypothetical protein
MRIYEWYVSYMGKSTYQIQETPKVEKSDLVLIIQLEGACNNLERAR